MKPLPRSGCAFSAILLAALELGAPAFPEEKREPLSEEIVLQATRAPDRYLLGWNEYRSQHFLVDSDLPGWTVAELIRKLEKLRAVELRCLLAKDVPIPGRVRVIASSTPLLFSELARDRFFIGSFARCQTYQMNCRWLMYDEVIYANGSRRGGCTDDLFVAANHFVSRLGEPIIVLPVAGGGVHAEVIAHEVAHYLASVLFFQPPPWFREGFASFVQTIGSDPLENPPPTGTHIRSGERVMEGAVGLAPPGLMAALCRDHVSAGEALTWDGEESSTRPGRYHAQSWLLYHWLWNMRSSGLSEFQRRLANAENPDLAWRQAFPEFDPQRPGGVASLDKALLRYELNLSGSIYYRRKAEPDTRYTESALPPSDVHVLLLDARYSVQPQKLHWLGPELTKLLEEEPLQAEGISWRADIDRTSPLLLLRKAVEKFPRDWRAWLMLGRAEEDGDRKLVAFQTAVKLNPDSALAHSELALLLASSEHPSDAFPFAKRATELAPWDAGATVALARIAAILNACDEAIEMHKRAMRLGARAGLHAQLDEVIGRCSAPRN